jgi:transposase-like protein
MNEMSSVAMSGGRSGEEAERLVREYERSGMTRAAFCRAQGIAPHTLDYYRRKHRKQVKPEATQLVAVELVGAVRAVPRHDSALRVELANGRRITVEQGFDAILLKRLIAALEG